MRHYPGFAAAFSSFLRELGTQSVVVIGHQRPDGDCIGSQVALTRVLRSLGIDAVCLNPDPVPRRIKFLVGDTPFLPPGSAVPANRLVIFADCADHARAGEAIRTSTPAPFACFDHHLSNHGFAKHNFVDTGSAATAELLTGLFIDAELPLDDIAAQALYTGIMTDTGQFRFPSTTRRTFVLAGELLARGASPTLAGSQLYERETLAKFRLISSYLGSLKLECDKRACIGVLPRGIFEQTGASIEDTEGLVDYARSLDGVEVGVLIEERGQTVKASLRAQDPRLRMDSVASQFNGGGHACAAGLNFPGTLADFYPRLVAALAQRFREVDAEPVPLSPI